MRLQTSFVQVTKKSLIEAQKSRFSYKEMAFQLKCAHLGYTPISISN